MYTVNYHRAKSISEAGKLAQQGDSKFLSGGMTLIPAMKTRLAAPSDLIDLTHVDGLSGIAVSGKEVTIGAATTHYDVSRNEKLRKVCPALTDLASHIGDPHVRYCGTIGGSIANNDPAADYPAACLGLGATIRTNKRTIAADDFFKGMFETALGEGEIITAVSFPVPAKAGYAKFPNPASRYAIVGVFVAKTGAGVRVAVTGAGPCVFRDKAIEGALGGSWSADAVKGSSAAAGSLNSDLHASAEYRAHLIGVMARRAVQSAG